MNDSMSAPIAAQPGRDRLVRKAVEQLQSLAEQSDKLIDELRTTFSSVVFAGRTKAKEVEPDNRFPGSDLGQTLISISEQFDRHFRSIRELIEDSDL